MPEPYTSPYFTVNEVTACEITQTSPTLYMWMPQRRLCVHQNNNSSNVILLRNEHEQALCLETL